MAALLVAITLWVFAPVRGFPFVNWDDADYVSANAGVLNGLTGESLSFAFTQGVSGNWHPVTMLSHMADVELFGLEAGAHHMTNVLLHVLATLALFGALRAMTQATGPSAFVAAVFAVHPLHVESVAWISERKDVLSTAFVMFALLAYVRYVQMPSLWRYLCVVLLYVPALLSKPMVVTFPVLLLILDLWPLRRLEPPGDARRIRALVVEKLPLFVLAAAVAIATVVFQEHAVAGLQQRSIGARAATVVTGYATYLLKAIWPVNLSAFYPLQPVSTAVAGASAALLVALAAAAIATVRTAPFIAAGLAWFVIAVLPVSGIVQTGSQAMADRYTYLALAGLAITAAWGAMAIAGARVQWRRLAGVLGICVVVAMALTARRQVMVWQDSESLWSHAVSVNERNYRAHEKLAEAYRDRGAADRAWTHYLRAVELAPPDASASYRATIQNALGLVLIQQGDLDAASGRFREAVQLNPSLSEAHSNLGATYAKLGNFDAAAPHYEEAIKLSPGNAALLADLGGVRLGQGRHDEARTALVEAIRIAPRLAAARARLASVLVQQGRDEEAMTELRAAIAVDPRQAPWRYALALLLLKSGRSVDAAVELRAALQAQPDFEPARRALATIEKRGP